MVLIYSYTCNHFGEVSRQTVMDHFHAHWIFNRVRTDTCHLSRNMGVSGQILTTDAMTNTYFLTFVELFGSKISSIQNNKPYRSYVINSNTLM